MKDERIVAFQNAPERYRVVVPLYVKSGFPWYTRLWVLLTSPFRYVFKGEVYW